MAEENVAASSGSKKTALGMAENVEGLLAYLLGLLSGILLFVLEPHNKFVRFHALQSICISVVMFVLSWVLMLIPVIGWIGTMLLPLVSFILWIYLMVKAYQGEKYKLPMIGDFVEKQVG